MRTKTVKLGGSLYIRIPHELVDKYGVEKNITLNIPEHVWEVFFESVEE